MATKTLFLGWQHVEGESGENGSRLWFPVGRLDADVLMRPPTNSRTLKGLKRQIVKRAFCRSRSSHSSTVIMCLPNCFRFSKTGLSHRSALIS